MIRNLAALNFLVAALALVLGGYVGNIVKLMAGTEAAAMLVLRAVGILLAPLGVVVGWF